MLLQNIWMMCFLSGILDNFLSVDNCSTSFIQVDYKWHYPQTIIYTNIGTFFNNIARCVSGNFFLQKITKEVKYYDNQLKSKKKTCFIQKTSFLCQSLKWRASLIGSDYYQMEPKPGSGPEGYYLVVPIRAKEGAKVVPFQSNIAH